MNKFDTINAIKELAEKAEKWQDRYMKVLQDLIYVQEELIKVKQELQERDRNWEAHCQEIQDEMKEKYNEIIGEMINDTNREDLL